MESSTAETRDQQEANVVHVAAAETPFRVDSTTQLLPGSSNDIDRRDDDDNEAPRPSANSRVASNTTAAHCGINTFGCCPPNSTAVGLPAITAQRPDVHGALCYTEVKNGRTPTVNHDSIKPISDASPGHDVGGGSDTLVDDMVTFRAALDAVDPSALGGLRRARSKSVLVPVCRPPPAAVRFRSRGSVQCDQMTRDDDDADMDDDTDHTHHRRRLYQQQQQTAKAVQTSVSYTRERYRSASLATQRSRRSRDSATMSEMCLEYMRLNGVIPRYPSLQQQYDDAVIRSPL